MQSVSKAGSSSSSLAFSYGANKSMLSGKPSKVRINKYSQLKQAVASHQFDVDIPLNVSHWRCIIWNNRLKKW
jgi:hypothetical protein